MRAHEVHQVGLYLHDLLSGAGSGGLDVAGQGECSGTEVNRGDGLTRHAELVDHVTDALDVFEEELARIIQVHMRLRRAIDDEGETARHPPIGFDHRAVPAELENRGRMFSHPNDLAIPAARPEATLVRGAPVMGNCRDRPLCMRMTPEQKCAQGTP